MKIKMKIMIMLLSIMIVVFNNVNCYAIGNKVDRTLKYSKSNINITDILTGGMFNDIYLKQSNNSNINVTLNCIAEGKDKKKINDILKEIELKIEEHDNQYILNLCRNGENLIILSNEMKNIDYIKFNLIIEIPRNIKTVNLRSVGSVKFDNLNLDKIDISSTGDIRGINITSKNCTLLANKGVIEVDKLNCDILYIRTYNKLKSKVITSKNCTLLANKGVVEVDKLNCDILYVRTYNKLKSKVITSKDCTLLVKKAIVQVDKYSCDKLQLYKN